MKHKQEKIELIKNGTFNNFKKLLKEQYNNECEINWDPSFYNVNEQELEWLKQLLKNTKRKKQDFRNHIRFMATYYDNVGFLTLTWNNETINKSNLETKKQQATTILKLCFNDYIGKFEISKKGRIHAHFIVCWNGDVKTRKTNNFKNDLVINKNDLTNGWSKYGIYDLVLVDTSSIESQNKTSNYVLKSLNTMESYIDKNEIQDKYEIELSDDLIVAVNTSNVMTKRNSDYQKWKHDNKLENKEIRSKCRTFDYSYYQQHKYDCNEYFKQWAYEHKHDKLTSYLNMFPDNYELIDARNYITELVNSE